MCKGASHGLRSNSRERKETVSAVISGNKPLVYMSYDIFGKLDTINVDIIDSDSEV
jgi:hypothetical protein